MKLYWGNAIFIFFTVFVSLSIAFIVFSLRQDIDLVEDDYYNQGANYSNQIKINQRSAKYSDSIFASVMSEQILITLPASVREITDSLKVHFYNPSSKNKDYRILLTNLNDSNYIQKINLVDGRYILKLQWGNANNEFNIEKN